MARFSVATVESHDAVLYDSESNCRNPLRIDVLVPFDGVLWSVTYLSSSSRGQRDIEQPTEHTLVIGAAPRTTFALWRFSDKGPGHLRNFVRAIADHLEQAYANTSTRLLASALSRDLAEACRTGNVASAHVLCMLGAAPTGGHIEIAAYFGHLVLVHYFVTTLRIHPNSDGAKPLEAARANHHEAIETYLEAHGALR